MFFNPNLLLTAGLGVALYQLGKRLSARVASPWGWSALGVLLLLACLPGISFIAYYLHLFGEPLWYIEFRSLPFAEALAALWGLFFGFISPKTVSLLPRALGLFRLSNAALCALLIFVPFAKPVLLPVALSSPLKNTWQDGVCRQSTPSTCGAASLATLFAHYGLPRTEEQIARGAYSCASGTELWYLMRYARSNGLQARLLHEGHLAHVPTPAILGVRVGGYGHFITLLSRDGDRYLIGDPLNGRNLLTEEEFKKRYEFGGCVLQVTR